MHKTGQTSKIINGVFLLEVVWWLKENMNITNLSAFPWVKEPLCYSCLHTFPPGITQQKAVNMQSRLISFPRSLVQKRAPCVNKSAVCHTKCDFCADG